MSDSIPPNIQELSRHYVDGRRFTSSDEVLVFAMDLFVEFERQFQQQLEASLKESSDAIAAGEGVTLNGQPEIETYFQDKMQINMFRDRPQNLK